MLANRVFFSNVPFTTTEETLRDIFERCGTIVDLRLFTKPRSNQFKGMGVCEYSTDEEAQNAIGSLLDVDVDGRKLWVSEDTNDKGYRSNEEPPPKESRKRPAEMEDRAPRKRPRAVEASGDITRVFFSNVPFTTTEDTLVGLFQDFGAIEKLLLFQGVQGFRGMGVCVYESPDAAAQAVQELMDVDVDGRPMWVAFDTDNKNEPGSVAPRQAALPVQNRKPPGRPVAIQQPTEVFFSNVPYSTTEETIRQVFSGAGEVRDVKFFRQKSGESRGMGVVTFAEPESVQTAIQTLRDAEVDERSMWVSTHTRSADASDGGRRPARGVQHPTIVTRSSRVFFSNVPFDVEEETLERLFEEAGKVEELTLFKKQDGSSRGMGHCTFTAPSMAAAAIQGLRDRDVGGRPIWIAEDTKDAAPAPREEFPRREASRPPSGGSATPSSGSRVYFGNVPFDVSESTLEKLFKGIGPIIEFNLFKNPDGKSRGMGHCIYQNASLASVAIQLLRDRDVGGRPILVKEDDRHAAAPPRSSGPVRQPAPRAPTRGRALPPAPAAPRSRQAQSPGDSHGAPAGCRVFFSNVPFQVGQEELVDVFQQVGEIVELNLFRKDNGQSRGMGHCTFSDPSAAEAAISELRDLDVGGRPIWVSEDSRSNKGPAPPVRTGSRAVKDVFDRGSQPY
mmetsp:Transcript_52113/g.93400  ORF Transcript_52113/g.93400 Transcript_52113/m.93400 type:complete len:674 (+) Transcript_52113:74-2095(+)